MDNAFNGDQRYVIYVYLNLLCDIIGALCSLITILLIHRMGKIKAHIWLVLIMSYYQLLYDVTLFFSNVNFGYYITLTAIFWQIFAGIAGSLMSNWIAYVALHIIRNRSKCDIFKHRSFIFWTSTLPGLIDGIFYIIVAVPESKQNDFLISVAILDIYYYIRLLSIFVNFAFAGWTAFRISQMSTKVGVKSPQELAIQTMSRRMVLYPIVQAIGRSGNAWYEKAYGANISEQSVTQTQYSCQIFLSIITPFVSVGYLAIFLIMQPDAYNNFIAMIGFKQFQRKPISGPTSMRPTMQMSVRSSLSHQVAFLESSNASSSGQTHGVYPDQSRTLADWNRPSSFFYHSSMASIDQKDEDELLELIGGSDYSGESMSEGMKYWHSRISTRFSLSFFKPASRAENSSADVVDNIVLLASRPSSRQSTIPRPDSSVQATIEQSSEPT